MNEYLMSVINAQKKRAINSPSGPYLLNSLLTAKDENDNPLTDIEILSEFKTLLLTGHETTACTLTWMWHLLSLHPEWRASLEHELDHVLKGRPPTVEALPHLPLLKAILHETMRLYPAIWALSRTNLEEDTLYGYVIPKGSLIALNVYVLHRHPEYWDKPNEFNPQRFLERQYNPLHPFAYLPFSTGPRTCIASHMASIEALLIAGTLAQYFQFDKYKKTKIRLEPCISLRPKKGLWLKVKQRER